MAISLQKGQRISLSKEAPGLSKIICGLGWDVLKPAGGGFFSNFGNKAGQEYDLDASVICLSENGKLTDNQNIIYFGNLSHPSGAIVHQGDNLTGAGDGDDEIIILDLARIPSSITKLVFVVNIYDCQARKQDFSKIENAFVRLVNVANNQELARFNLSGQDYQGMTGMVLAEVYRHNDEWKMAAIGNGVSVNGLGELVKTYI
ncbi:TerD family protein [Chamaesiphon polymorphus]|uniref:Stress protein n=1 Tax=Chamaesiphon polymorphus CCALA 037 TaxID=2107692 RepID=A0A2T1GFQ0_9CYAN|nr:TerD family protein [Chamaesiphon polymorphus]PSB56431.1 stress protein [Chamaesiphon polymorphus CCALA 037]